MAVSNPKLTALYALEADLLQELRSIRQMIVNNGGTPTVIDAPVVIPKPQNSNVTSKQFAEGLSRGDLTWDNYVDFVGDLLGDARTSDIIDYMRKANPGTPIERIGDAVSTRLTRKVKAGALPFTAGATKKAGYTYHFKDRHKIKAA